MEIILKNIGVISESSIVLDGLTVITGKNGTGKTTVGKAVYSLIDAVNNLQGKAEDDKKTYSRNALIALSRSSNLFAAFQSIGRQSSRELRGTKKNDDGTNAFTSRCPLLCGLKNYLRTPVYLEVDHSRLIERLMGELRELDDLLRQYSASEPLDVHFLLFLRELDSKHLMDFTSSQDVIRSIESQIKKDTQTLHNLLSVLEQEPDREYARHHIDQTLNTEFSHQIQPVGCSEYSIIQFMEKGRFTFDVHIQNNHVRNDYEFSSTLNKAFFIDNPSILDRSFSSSDWIWEGWEDDENDGYFFPSKVVTHDRKMAALLHETDTTTILEQSLRDTVLRPIKEKINVIIPGTFDFSSSAETYIRPDGNKIPISNLAAGSKMFSILKILLERGMLDENTFLILDEPEIHLHPAWQNQFAELIVLLVKELKVKVLMTTHSSNFMLAIDAYMRKYGINEQVNFYQAEQLEDGFVTHRCVNDHMELIYQDFLNYFAEVKVLRDRYALGYDENGDGE